MKKLGTRELIRRGRDFLLVAKRAREHGTPGELVADQRGVTDRVKRKEFSFTKLDWRKAEPRGRD